ncbi:hypothetical protein ACTFIW_007840 [Dictyostelium discoideum]
MSTSQKSSRSSSSGSSMSLIIGFSRSIEKGSFGVLYAMIKGNTFPKILTLLSIVVEFCQLSSFGFKHQYPWGGEAGYYLKRIMSPINHPSNLVGYTGFTIFFWIVVGLLVLGFLNIWYVAYKFYHGKIANIWVIRTLRWFVSFSVAVLFIPITSLLLIGLDCDYSESTLRNFESENIECFKGENLPISVVSILLIAAFSLVGFTSSATYYEYDTNIKSRFAKPHARFDVLVLFAKLVFSLLNSLIDYFPWLTSIVFFIVMFFLVIGSIIVLPYNNQRLNQLKSGFYMVLFWVSFVTIITMAINDETSPATSYLVVIGIFPSFPIGYFLNRFYYRWLCKKVDDIRVPTSGSCEFNSEEKSKSDSSIQQSTTANNSSISNTAKVTWGKQPVSVGSKRQIIFPFFEKKYVFSFFVEIMARKLLIECNSGDSISNCCSMESIERANNLYQCGLQYFPNSDLLWMAYCNFLFTVRKDRHIGYASLEKLRRMNPSFDVRFFIYQRDKEREQIMDSDLRGPEHNAIWNLKKLYYGAKRYHIKCLTYIKRFWGHLLHETVDLHRLSELSGRIATTENKANESYERLLALNPNSVRVLRDYSQFLEEVVKDKESAYRLQKKAETIEEIMSRIQTTDFKINDIKNLDDSETEVDKALKNDQISSNKLVSGGIIDKAKSESSKSKDDESESSSSSKGRKNKYREYQQSNAISKLSWLMIGTTTCCIIFLIIMLVVFRGLEVKHVNSYQGIISITDCASEAVSIAINLNSMQSIASSIGTIYTLAEATQIIDNYRIENQRRITVMKNIHNAIYWGESDPISYVGDYISILKSRNGFNIFDIGSIVFSFDQFNRSDSIINNKEMQHLYNEPSINMTVLIKPPKITNETQLNYFIQTYNSWKAGNMFIESAILANTLTVEQYQNDSNFDVNFKFVILNGASSIPNMYISIQKAFIDSLNFTVMQSLNIMWYVWLGIFGFLILIGSLLFRPIVSKISREKIRTLILFSLAPKEVVVKLSTKKIKMVSLDSGSERDNLFESTDGDDDNNTRHEHLNDFDDRRKRFEKDHTKIQVNERRPLMDSIGVLSSTTTLNSSKNIITDNGNNSNNNNKNSEKSDRDNSDESDIDNSDDDNNINNSIIKPIIEENKKKKEKTQEEINELLVNNKKYGWDGKSKRNLNKKSLKSVLSRLHLSYSFAIILLFGFISMGLWVSYSVVYENSQSGIILGTSCERSLNGRVINFYASELLTFDNDIQSNQSIINAIEQLQSNHQSLPYLEEVRPLMEGTYGCWQLDQSKCLKEDSIYYNDVNLGLDWIVESFFRKILNLINTDQSLLSTSEDYQWLKAIGSELFLIGLDTATFKYFLHYQRLQEWATMVLTSILAVNCVILLIIYMALFRPFMNHLRIQHIHTLALLRLAPDDIRYMEISDKAIDED